MKTITKFATNDPRITNGVNSIDHQGVLKREKIAKNTQKYHFLKIMVKFFLFVFMVN